MSSASERKDQLEHKRKRAVYLQMNEQEDLHALKCVVFKQVARKRGPELELQLNNKHWQLSDNLERAQVKLLSEALRHSIYERDAYSS